MAMEDDLEEIREEKLGKQSSQPTPAGGRARGRSSGNGSKDDRGGDNQEGKGFDTAEDRRGK